MRIYLSLQKLTKLEEELSKRPFPDDDLTDSVKSDGSVPKPKDSSDLEETVEHYRERLLTQMSVEEELRQAANRTKEVCNKEMIFNLILSVFSLLGRLFKCLIRL